MNYYQYWKNIMAEACVQVNISENLVYSHKLYYNTDPLGLISVSK